MRINKLALSNFKSYKGDHSLDLSKVHTCAIIGGNGSGKSTIAEALVWGLFGYTRMASAKDLLHPGTKALSVIVDFTAEGHEYHVFRSYNGSMEATVTMDGVAMTQYASGVTPAIVKVLGVSRELIAESIVIQQGQLASFANATPSERRDLIMAMLGMDKYQKAFELARDAHKTLSTTISAYGANVDSMTKQLEAIPDYTTIDKEIGSLTAQISEVNGRITIVVQEEATLKAQVDQTTIMIKESDLQVARLRNEIDTRDRETQEQINELNRKLQIAQKAIALGEKEGDNLKILNRELEQVRLTLQCIQIIRTKMLDYEGKITAQQSRIKIASTVADACPLCKAPLTSEARQAMLNNLQTELSGLVNVLNESKAELDRIPTPRGIEIINSQIEESRGHITNAESNQRLRDRYIEEINRIRAEWQTDMDTLTQELAQATQKITSLKAATNAVTTMRLAEIAVELIRLREYHGIINKKLMEWSGNKQSRETLEHSLSNVSSMLTSAKSQLPEAEFIVSALSPNGVPLMLVDSCLPAVESRARELTYLVSDGTLDLKLSVDGKKVDLFAGSGQLRPVKALSGGEQTRVSLALRLALSQVLFETAGCKFDCLVIDEPEYLDETGISQFVSAISNLQSIFAQIFVISHVPAVKSAFGQYIMVEKNQDISKATLIS